MFHNIAAGQVVQCSCLSDCEHIFTFLAEEQVNIFYREAESKEEVLLFPPSTSRKRYLIHDLVSRYKELKSVSVGEDPERRTAVFFRATLPKQNCRDPCKMTSMSTLPPEEGSSVYGRPKEKPRERVRKPEREIYVPKHRRPKSGDSDRKDEQGLQALSTSKAPLKTKRSDKGITTSRPSSKTKHPDEKMRLDSGKETEREKYIHKENSKKLESHKPSSKSRKVKDLESSKDKGCILKVRSKDSGCQIQAGATSPQYIRISAKAKRVFRDMKQRSEEDRLVNIITSYSLRLTKTLFDSVWKEMVKLSIESRSEPNIPPEHFLPGNSSNCQPTILTGVANLVTEPTKIEKDIDKYENGHTEMEKTRYKVGAKGSSNICFDYKGVQKFAERLSRVVITKSIVHAVRNNSKDNQNKEVEQTNDAKANLGLVRKYYQRPSGVGGFTEEQTNGKHSGLVRTLSLNVVDNIVPAKERAEEQGLGFGSGVQKKDKFEGKGSTVTNDNNLKGKELKPVREKNRRKQSGKTESGNERDQRKVNQEPSKLKREKRQSRKAAGMEARDDKSGGTNEVTESRTLFLEEDLLKRDKAGYISKFATTRQFSETSDIDDWENRWDEDGKCLDQKTVKELAELTGIAKPAVKQTKIDYQNFTPQEVEVSETDFGHIIEVNGISKEMKTSEVCMALTSLGAKDFNLQWVDDNHALAVFSSVLAAQSCLQMVSPVVKLTPISKASRQSKLKAKLYRDVLLPYKERPETTAFVARNLVTSALGLRSKTSVQQRANERLRLSQAREKKKQREKARADIWGDE